jgi:hypothetical protein
MEREGLPAKHDRIEARTILAVAADGVELIERAVDDARLGSTDA